MTILRSMRRRRKSPWVVAVLLAVAVVGYLQKQPGKGSVQKAPPPPVSVPAPGPVGPQAEAPSSDIGVRIRVRRVIDGDTLEAQRDDGRVERIRIFGINTPELHPRPGVPHDTFTPQKFAQEARDRLAALCPEGQDARMVERGRDKYSRLLARVYTAGGQDVARTLIEEGLARSYFVEESRKDTLRPYFEAAQDAAKQARKGVWSLPQK